MTSASTQPPPTEPRSRPSAPTSILVPVGTGVDPAVRATVASAPAAPARTSSAAVRHRLIALAGPWRRESLAHLDDARHPRGMDATMIEIVSCGIERG